MDTKALRQKILDLAIRGQLVPQDPTDEPASVLLERIRAEKQQMVKDGKLKAKDIKNDTVIFVGEDNLHYEKFADGSVKCIEDEIPFELPEGWAWTRLGTLIDVFITGPFGSALHKSDYVTGGIPLINPINIVDGKVVPVDKMQVSPETVERLASFKVAQNDIVIARRGDMGRCAVVMPEQNGWLCGTGSFVLRFPRKLCSEYFAACIRSPYSVEYLSGNSIGNTMLNLNQAILKSLLLPVPPLKEQERITANIEKSNFLIERISDDREQLSHIVEIAKSKILDLAIRGKLVPQDPNDEPASVLLERICTEKEALIKAGKLKRDKKESVIFRGDDNSYYCDIPDNWILCSLKELFNVCSAKRVRQSEWKTSGVPFYRAREIVKLSDNGYVDNDLFISEEHYMKMKTEFGVPKSGDLMVSGVGTIGRVYIVKENDRFYYKDASVLCFENRTGAVDPQFARYMLESKFMQAQMKENSKGTTVDTITISAAMDYVCVLPPLAEQKRIVTATKEAFSQLEKISEALV